MRCYRVNMHAPLMINELRVVAEILYDPKYNEHVVLVGQDAESIYALVMATDEEDALEKCNVDVILATDARLDEGD